jgi:pimeloyl-ACP methyl ester carboxylesterase
MATIVLLPGAGGDPAYWLWVTPILQSAGHEVVAVDLPAGDETAGLDEYADAALDALGKRRGNIVVVAQSLGAFTAAVLCERLEVELLIFVGAMIPAVGETAGEWWANTGQAEAERAYAEAEGRDPDAPYDPVVTFFHDVPPRELELILADEERPQAGAPFSSPMEAARWKQVPTRVLAGLRDRIFPIEFMRRISRERLGLEPDVIDSGHLPGFSRPEELAYRILAYVDEPRPAL